MKYNIFKDSNKRTLRQRERMINWGHSLESLFSCWPVNLPKKSAAFPCIVCHCFAKECLCDTETLRGAEGPCAQRIVHCIWKKKGLQWLVGLEKTLQPLLASSLFENFPFRFLLGITEFHTYPLGKWSLWKTLQGCFHLPGSLW